MSDDAETLERLVREIFVEISRGNFSPLLDRCADDVELYVGAPPEVPFGGRFRGREYVEKFLREAVRDVIETYEFAPREFIVTRDRAVVQGHALCRVRANGVEYRNEWLMVMTYRNGQFTHLAEYLNSALIVYALRGETGRLTQ